MKLEHTVFSLPLILAGAWLHTRGWPGARLTGLIVLAAIGGRVMAMGLNRIIDAEIDARNPRTKLRELPRKLMSKREAWLIIALAGLLYAASAFAIAPICLQLAPIPIALFVAYPYLKRVTVLVHLGLGVAWSMAPLGGWLAAVSYTGSPAAASYQGSAAAPSVSEGLRLIHPLANLGEIGWLWLFAVLWVTGFDIIYATMDEGFDREFGLRSLPATIGRTRALRLSEAFHGGALACLWALWRYHLHGGVASLGWLMAIAALFLWQHAIAAKRPNFAFFHLNAIIGFWVLGLVVTGVV